MFNKLPLRDLNNCSLVCKLWLGEAKRVKKNRQSIQLTSQEGISELLRKINASGAPKIDKFDAQLMNLEDPKFDILLTSLEPTLSTLILSDGKVTLKTFHKLIRKLPNLVRLEIGTLKTERGEYLSLFPIYDESVPPKMIVFDKIESLEFISYVIPATNLSSAIKTFPKLKRLNVFNLQCEKADNFKATRIETLEELTLTCFPGAYFGDEHLKMLLELKVDTLKSLTITNIRNDLSLLLMKEFFDMQKSTLTTLQLHSDEIENVPSSVNLFPMDLPNLTYLVVDKPYVQNLSHVCSLLPKLKEICFHFRENSNWMGIFPKKIEEFKAVTGCNVYWIEPKPLRMLSTMFPCITSLQMHKCSNDILRAIYSSMPNLEFLICFDLIDGQVNEEGFTGIETNRLAELLDISGEEITSESLEELRHFPAITRLESKCSFNLRV